MDKIFITGSSGFVGSSVINKLNLKTKVYCLVRNIPSRRKRGVIYLKGDLFNETYINKILKKYKFKYLIHLAWEATPIKFWNSKKNRNFLVSSTNLFYNFCKNGGKYAFFTGSVSECNLDNKKIFEKDYLENFNLSEYTLSKYLLYKNVLKISEIFKTKFMWARIFWIYGKGQPKGKLIADLISSLRSKKKFVVKNMFDKINLMHVEDVGSSIASIFKKKIKGIANIASEKNYMISDIKYMINDKLLSDLIILKDYKNNYSFDRIIINILKKIKFKEKMKINVKINELLS